MLHLLLRHMEEQKAIIASFMHGQGGARVHGGVTEHLLLLKWTLLALGKLFDQQPNIVHMAHEQGDAIRKLKVCMSRESLLLSEMMAWMLVYQHPAIAGLILWLQYANLAQWQRSCQSEP